MDCTVHGVAKSWTGLRDFLFPFMLMLSVSLPVWILLPSGSGLEFQKKWQMEQFGGGIIKSWNSSMPGLLPSFDLVFSFCCSEKS